MGRSVRLALGAIAAALAAQHLGANQVGAVVALALAILLVLAETRRGSRGRGALPIAIGAAFIAGRLVLLPTGPVALLDPPEGSGPWSLVVLATGSPRDGQQTATLGTLPGTAPAFAVAATLPRYPVIVAGDRVEIGGTIRRRPASPYGQYLQRIGAVGTISSRTFTLEPRPADPGRWLEDLRRGAAEALARVLPEPEAGLAAGILIGLRDRVDRDLATAFTTAGVSHVVAISGWNIAIVAAAIATIAGRLGRRRRSLVTMLAIVVYVAFAGASASVVRAALMAALVLLARETGRAGRAAAALGWAATLLLISDPKLIGDAGFQLSSLATAGLIVWATPLTAWIERIGRGRMPRWLAESLGVSLAAQAATLPIVLVSFGRLAILSPLVNLVVVPLVAPAMAVGLLALAGGAVVLAGAPPGIGAVIAAPGWVVLRALVAIVQFAAGLPLANVSLVPPLDIGVAGLSVVGLVGLTWWRGGSSSRGSRPAPPPSGRTGTTVGTAPRPLNPGRARSVHRLATWLLILATVVAGGVVVARPAGTPRVAILDVGQGDAILVEGSRGGRLLIDGGPDPDRLLVALDREIPPWDRRIDSVILSHPHEDHVAGLALLLERYRVGRVLEPGMRGPGPGYAAWLRELSGAHAPVRLGVAAGDHLTVDEIDLRVLWPIRGRVPLEPPDGGTGINNVSVVLAGQVAGRRFLLMGDVEEAIDPQLLAAGLPRVDLLKVAHHGSRTATTQGFVDAVRPRIAVASAGAGNPYGHPARATLERLANAGARVLRTDRDGTVVIGFGPDGVTVRTEGGRGGVTTSKPSAAASILRFRCAVPVTALVPERETPVRGAAAGPREPVVSWRTGIGGPVGYHRDDDRSRAGGGRLPPALPGSPTLARSTFARRRGGRRMARGADRGPWRGGRSARCGGGRPAARRGQGTPGGRSIARAPPWRGVGRLADPARPCRAGRVRGEPSSHATSRRRGVPAVGLVCLARGADRRVRGQARRAAPRVDGRSVCIVAAPLPADECVRPSERAMGRGDLRRRPSPRRPARSRRLSGRGRGACRCLAPPLDRPRDPVGPDAGYVTAPVATSPLAYLWGDDELAAARAVAALQATLGAETGAPPDRWDLRGDRNRAAEQIAGLRERIATPVMFGGGSMAVVSNPGVLVRASEQRTAFLATFGLVAPGNALVILDATPSGAKAPSQKRLADAVTAAGGAIRRFDSPRRGALAGWIEAEARQRDLQLAPGAAKALAERIGGFVDLNDVERRHQTRIASLELDKLGVYRGSSAITPDDVVALVAEAVPGSMWAFTDAVGERRGTAALGLLEQLMDETPEPVLLAVLHRRVRELLELGDRVARGERLAAAAKAMGIASEYRAQTLAAQARHWTTDELVAALDGLVELDAMVKGAPGAGQDEPQRRLAFSLWVMDHGGRNEAARY